MKDEFKIFNDYLEERGLKHTAQRRNILETFLGIERHISVDELFRILKRKDPKIGFSTVYRTLKLMTDCGLARELAFEGGVVRFEHHYDHPHHDHLICTRCWKYLEFVHPTIEHLQDEIAESHKFTPEKHKLEIYGMCAECAQARQEPSKVTRKGPSRG